jgi:hypothetical protein
MIIATHGIVASAGAVIINPLLDDYPNAAAAYSLRKLRSAYTGSAIRVRRSSDNTEQDIGFSVLGGLDTSSLTSFCGSGNGFVTTWYDQSGNARNVTQSTAANQPQIVSSGSVILENSKPTLQFDGSNDWLINATINISQPITRFSIAKSTNTGTGALVDSNTTNRFILYKGGGLDQNGNFVASYNNTGNALTVTNNSNRNLFYELANSGSNEFAINGNTATIGNNGTNGMNQLSIGNIRTNIVGGYTLAGNFQELVIYSSNQSSNRTGIQSNINTYYAIY